MPCAPPAEEPVLSISMPHKKQGSSALSPFPHLRKMSFLLLTHESRGRQDMHDFQYVMCGLDHRTGFLTSG